MALVPQIPFFVSIPHSGERVPKNVTWLTPLPEVTLMRDVDRFVDKLYQPAIEKLKLPAIVAEWHRYVVDLNRYPDEFDAAAVEGAPLAAGTHPKGLHWCVTTLQEELIKTPMTMELHQELLEKYYQPFHQAVQDMRTKMKASFGQVFHLDLHSMPSVGTALHSDPGERRAEVVVSDFHGASTTPEYKDIVMQAFQTAGLQVAYNWPYVGGGITKMYGQPQEKCHTIQVELNRSLYMNEETKALNSADASELQKKLTAAIENVVDNLGEFLNG